MAPSARFPVSRGGRKCSHLSFLSDKPDGAGLASPLDASSVESILASHLGNCDGEGKNLKAARGACVFGTVLSQLCAQAHQGNH